jgi:hypothetical protein
MSYRILTSPSTVSIGIKLALFSLLLAISAGFTALALAGFWFNGRGGSVVEVEGWFIYGYVFGIRHCRTRCLFSDVFGSAARRLHRYHMRT